MDQRNPSSVDSTYRLLALCTHAEGHTTFYEQLNQEIEQFTAWDELPAQAETHGMGPLLWHHIRQAGISIPVETERILRGLYLRDRALNQAHALTLVEVLGLFKEVDIQPLVLKGLALANKYYPDPALRPISDIDLLLKKDDVLTALLTLEKAGYHVRFPEPDLTVLPNELTADSPSREGISTHLEFHHYDPKHRRLNDYMRDTELAGFVEPPQEFLVNGCTVNMPSPMDTLRYLERHLVRHLFLAHADKPVPLKWSADIISLVEYHAEEIDWGDIQHHNPAFLHRLTVLYSLTPLPAKYEGVIPVKKSEPPDGLNQYPSGWPQQAFSNWKRAGLWRFIGLTFRPPTDWWLRLYYGIDENKVIWFGQVIYRVRVFSLMLWGLRTAIKNLIKSVHGSAIIEML